MRSPPRLFDTVACAVRQLRRRANRTITVLAGFALASGMAVVLVTILATLRDDAVRVLTGTGTHFIAFVPYPASSTERAGSACTDCAPILGSREGFTVENVATTLFPLSVLEQARTLPSVLDASPYLLYRLETQGDTASGVDTTVVGGFDTTVPAAVRATTCAPADVIQGRFLAPYERGAALVEEGAARRRGLAVGDGVALAGRELRVAGIVNTGIRPVKADLYLNIQDAEELIQGRLRNPLASRFNVLLVEARSATVHERAMAEVRELVGDSSVLSTYACYRPAAAVLGSNERGILILLVTTCALVLAFAWKSQHASLVERRRELGVLRAIGWSDRDILAQLLIESVMLALLGCVAGCVLATAGLLATSLADVPRGVPSAGLRLSWQAYGSALLFALSGGTIAGLLPAAGALRKSASEMLRAL